MIEITVLLSIIVVTIFFFILAASLDSDTADRTTTRSYGPAKIAEEMHHPTLIGGAQGAGLGGYYGGRISSRESDRRE
ncbi:MAG: hypothetical protein ACFFD6_01225 [Candidatus Thorarchaeota archaeon]